MEFWISFPWKKNDALITVQWPYSLHQVEHLLSILCSCIIKKLIIEAKPHSHVYREECTVCSVGTHICGLLPRAHTQGVKQSVCTSVVGVIVVRTKIASLGVLGRWATCKVNKYIEIGEKLSHCALNCSALATSITNSAFLAMPVDHPYLLGHVLFAGVHNCHCMCSREL